MPPSTRPTLHEERSTLLPATSGQPACIATFYSRPAAWQAAILMWDEMGVHVLALHRHRDVLTNSRDAFDALRIPAARRQRRTIDDGSREVRSPQRSREGGAPTSLGGPSHTFPRGSLSSATDGPRAVSGMRPLSPPVSAKRQTHTTNATGPRCACNFGHAPIQGTRARWNGHLVRPGKLRFHEGFLRSGKPGMKQGAFQR